MSNWIARRLLDVSDLVRLRFHQFTTTIYKVVVFVDVIMFVIVNWPDDTTDTMLVLTGVH